ncbi:hypothetical protein CYY_001866 [Polysphondylium violaceum]|uniref:EGF-like domain-containing protein n=1 Tax=Polysphondylium violaceum TaxID=133409 RepID=A0A8J4PZ36_9MYCE|nr:hypothetical protein CYY_001866 [Polysphondylium violaceum]
MIKYISIIILLCCIFYINKVEGVNDSLPSNQRNNLATLISIYQLESVYSNSLNYCTNTTFIKCNTALTTVSEIKLKGNGATILSQNIFSPFNNLVTLQLSDTLLSDEFYNELPISINKLSIYNSNITTLPTSDSIRTITMVNVPIEDSLDAGQLHNIDSISITYTDYSLIRGVNLTLNNPNRPERYTFPRYFDIPINSFYNTSASNINSSTFFITIGTKWESQSLANLTYLNETMGSIKFSNFNQDLKPDIDLDKLSNITANQFSFFGVNTFISNELRNSFQFPKEPCQALEFKQITGVVDSNGVFDIRLNPNLQYLTILNSSLKYVPNLDHSYKVLDFSYNELSGPLPTSQNIIRSLKILLKANQLSGEVPQEYCFLYSDLSYNKLIGALPDCFVCALKSKMIKRYLFGNNFSNYQDTSTSFPLCSGITFTNHSKNELNAPIIINGTNLGWNYDDVIGSNYPFTILSKPELGFTVSIPNLQIISNTISEGQNSILNASKYFLELNFTIPNIQKSIQLTEPDLVIESIFAVRPYVNLGYTFIILVNGISTKQGQTVAKVGNLDCIITEISSNFIACIVYQQQMAEGDYLVTVSSNGKQDSIKYTFIRSPPFISAFHPPSKKGGEAIFWGDFGNDPTQTLYLLVGDENCTNIHLFNQSTLSCQLKPGDGLKQVIVNLNGTSWISSKTYFNYLEDEKTCTNCDHGQCNYGQCFCYEGYGGANCSNIIDAGVVERNENTVTISKDDYKFGFTIANITETDYNGVIQRSVPLTGWKITNDLGYKWTYATKFEKAIISYTIEMVNETKSVNFAGVEMQLTPGTVKLTANISNWQYLGSLNTIQMQVQSKVYSQENLSVPDKCGKPMSSLITADTDLSTTSLNYISIGIGNKVFYGKFIDRVLSDGKPTFARVTMNEKTNSSITVSINLPYCKECIIDPDFSVLVSVNQVDECGNELRASKKWVIPIAVVFSIVGAAIITALVIVYLRKKVYLSFSLKKGIVIVKKRKSTSKSEGSRMR